VNQPTAMWWTRLILVALGLFGAAFAVTGLLTPLPRPTFGGTCGPGQGSEAAIVALFDPQTIGAGPEPAATDTAGRAQWSAFVQECQTAADDRALAAFPVLIVSAGVAIIGAIAVQRRARRQVDPAPMSTGDDWWSLSRATSTPGRSQPIVYQLLAGASDVPPRTEARHRSSQTEPGAR
jgi:hypothetical protein